VPLKPSPEGAEPEHALNARAAVAIKIKFFFIVFYLSDFHSQPTIALRLRVGRTKIQDFFSFLRKKEE
jgi:hypothetical protein